MPSLSALSSLERALRSTLVLSVYCRSDAEDPAARTVWRAELLHRLSALAREHHADGHANREALRTAVAHVSAAVDAIPAATLMPGWVAFATAEGVHFAEPLLVSVAPGAWWGVGPRLAPLVVALPRRHPSVVAVVDARAVRLYAVEPGGVQAVETIQAEQRPGAGRHMGAPPQPGFHPGTRGDVGADTAETAKHASGLRMIARAVQRLEELAGPDGWILIGGTHDAASGLAKRLSPEAQLRMHLLRGLDVHATPAVIHAHAGRVLTELELAADQLMVAELLEQDAAGGLGTTGAPRSLSALGVGAVDQLTVTESFIIEHPELAEEAVRLALTTHARIGCVRGEAAVELHRAAGGIAVRLRYAPTAWTASRASATVEHGRDVLGTV
ncbi:MAG: hypothetical protein ACK5HM_10380 [Gemmatimonas sp.]|jgi:hypothetical protein|uniref:baeRF10 domain-containing protein n=1 Tax=Gemmatimonas sp. TaxID=1962908 RepID=UPI0022BCFD8D|nr:hypothetical protein [Gemmatimonas sp.]MCA2996866.1 hypothetical protein [Gemmatimonas sp.]MCZ8013619.1 hypothetical protein [Gemmatimonas sp.]MCZ8265876.1 hypothetical protein [Gemmatimonas sp.]